MAVLWQVRIQAALFAFLYLAAAIVLSSCAIGSGNISDGRYTSPLGNFSLPVPSGIGMRVSEANDESGGYVSFHDDFGSLSAINYLLIPADAVEVFRNPDLKDHAYAGFVHEYLLPDVFVPAFPDAEVVYGEFLGQGQDRVFFAVLDLPGGSHLVEITRAGRRQLDARRALLVFEALGTMYALQQEIGGPLQQIGEATEGIGEFSPDAEILERVHRGLYEFKATVEFR